MAIGLAAGVHPSRGDHDGEHLDQVAEHLERCTACPDDDCRSQLGDLALPPPRPHPLVAAGQVGGEGLALLLRPSPPR